MRTPCLPSYKPHGPTGPISGKRSRLEAEYAVGEVDFATLLGDYRNYFNRVR